MQPALYTVRDRLCHLYQCAGLRSWRDLDELAQLTPAMSSAYARSHSTPSVDVARKLAVVFGCDAGWLAFGGGRAPSAATVRAAAETAVRKALERRAVTVQSGGHARKKALALADRKPGMRSVGDALGA